MRPLELTARLAAFERRGPGSDAERRAALWLTGELRAQGDRVAIEPLWCRPNWALAHAWHVGLALAGSLVSVSHHALGAALLTVALVSMIADELTGVSPGRRLTPERASQNVVFMPAAHVPGTKPARLIVTANYDAGRTALIYRDVLRRPAASLRRAAGPFALGWLGWLSLAVVWMLAIAVIRISADASSSVLSVIQLLPSVALVLVLALLLEAAASGFGPAAGDNGSGAAVAITLTQALKAAPPRNLTVELVLQGAGEGQEIGLRRYLRAHGNELRESGAIVLGVAACGAGEPRWWESDGRLIPIRYTTQLRELADAVAAALPHRGRGSTPATPARLNGLPAIAIGTLDKRGLAPRSHQSTDMVDNVDKHAIDRAVTLGLVLVDAIDAALDPEPATSDEAATPA